MQNSLNQSEKKIVSFPKNAKEEVRLSEVVYLDKPYIDVRVFIKKANGEFVPTPKGITLSKNLISSLSEALLKSITPQQKLFNN